MWNPMNVVQKCNCPSFSSRNRPVIFGGLSQFSWLR